MKKSTRIALSIMLVCVSVFVVFGLTACKDVDFKVNFVVEGEVYATIKTSGNEVIKMPENPTKAGYNFDGWYWDEDDWKKPFTANSLLDAPLSSDMSVYAKFVSNEIPPTQASVVTGLKNIPNIVDVEAATEYNDPNGQLNKAGGYIADIFFSVDVINQRLISGTTLVEKGTNAGGSIEIYQTAKEAETRNAYLASFDGGIFASGSHKVIGTCVVRTALGLTASLQNILENNIEKMLTGSTDAYVSMDSYLFTVAKEIAEKDYLSEYETATKLIELGYPLEKAEQIAKSCGVNWNNIAKGLAEGYADYYAMVSPLMIAELLADHEFSSDNISYAIQNATIDWEFYATRHAEEFVSIVESQHEYLTPNAVLVYLCWEKGYIYDWDDYVFDKSEYCEIALNNLNVNWNQKALEYINYIEADGSLAQKSAYISELTGMDFTQEQAIYAVTNCNINWNSRALACIKHYVEDLCTTPPNHSACIAKLKEWGFSDSEANYAVNNYAGIIYPDKLDYVITLDPNNGTVSTTTIDAEYGKPFALPIPEREGYEFAGWYKGSTKIENGTWYTAENISVKAEWAPIRYNITYVLDGGTNGSGNPTSYTTGSSITLKVPTKTGYTFLGWKVNGSATAVYEAAIYSTDTGAKTFTATWTPNKYTIYYNADGGSVSVSSEDVYYDAWVTLKTPSRDGYTFTGWKEEGKTYSNGYWKTTRSVFLKATWELDAYSITYENMQNGTSSNPISYTVNDEIVLQAPTRTGYTFKGWTYSGQTTPVMSVTIPKNSTGNKTYTVNWEANTYTVTYNANGGTYDKVSETVTYGQYFKPAAATRTGYNFNNWHYDTGKGYDEEYCNDYYNIAGDITLEAWWNAKTFTITYNANGGSISSTTQSVSYDSNYTLRTPTRTGYTFKGWKNGTNDFTSGKWTLTSGVTLVAQWEANTYTITYDANGGEVSKTYDSIKFDSSLTLPTPTRVGYTFAGWYNSGTRYNSGSWTTAKSLTLTAKWTAKTNTPYVVNHYQQNIYDDGYTLVATNNKTGTSDASVTPARNSYTGFTAPSAQTVTISPDGTRIVNYYYTRNSYTITFFENGGEDVSSITAKYQAAITLPTPVKDGMTFGGWYLSSWFYDKATFETMPSSGYQLFARWNEETDPKLFKYDYATDGITVTGYTGTSSTMWIPTHIYGKPVIAISASAFANNTTITTVVVPATVETIGSGAFKGCTSLVDITLPFVGNSEFAENNYQQVFGWIFGYNDISNSTIADNYTTSSSNGTAQALEQWSYSSMRMIYYYIPKSIKNVTITKQTTIPNNAFRNCDLIEAINLADDTLSLGEAVFYNCKSVTAYNDSVGISSLPESITSIPDYAFTNNTALLEIFLPDHVESIGAYAFSGCTSLTGVKAKSTIVTLKTIGAYAFNGCTSLSHYFNGGEKEINIPSNTTSIGTYAFANNTSITKIVVPNTVSVIGSSAFRGCSALVDISLPFVGNSEDAEKNYQQVFGWIFGYNDISNSAIADNYSTNSSNGTAQALEQWSYSSMRMVYYYIPKSIRNVTITKQTAIPNNAFRNCDLIETINIPSNTVSLGSYAFYNCKAVTAYNGNEYGVSILPATLVNISDYAFNNNKALLKVVFSPVLESIGSYAFNGCTSLTEATTTSNITTLTTIGSYAFNGCTSLSYYFVGGENELNIPVNTVSVGTYAFANNVAITKVVVPDTVTLIGSAAFRGCSALVDISLPFVGNSEDAEKNYQQVFGWIFGYNHTSNSAIADNYSTNSSNGTAQALEQWSYSSMRMVYYYIPKSIRNVTITKQTAIPNNAFRNCDLIETVTLPSNVVSVGDYAFYNTKELTNTNISNTATIGKDAFVGSGILEGKTGVVYIGSVLYKYNGTMPSGYTLNVKAGTTAIQSNALSGCAGLAKVILPNSLISIGQNAFKNCSSLTDIEIPSSVTSIGSNAFSGCSKLTTISVPFIGTSVDSTAAFSTIFSTIPTTLTHVVITGDVTVNANAFKNCSKIQSIVFEGDVASIGNYAFYGCSALTTLTMPNTVTSIGDYAFSGCSVLPQFDISDMTALTAIGTYAFNGCKKLTEIVVPANVITIAEYAFNGCTSLANITLSNKTEKIGNYAFNGCSVLTTLVLESDVLDTIGAYAFQNCSALTTIYIPSTVTYIGEYAFNGCTNLTINCEASAMPADWDYNWNPGNCSVVWGQCKD